MTIQVTMSAPNSPNSPSIPSIPEHPRDVAIQSSPHLPGWKTAGQPPRVRFQPGKKRQQGVVLSKDAFKHREFKKKRGKNAVKRPPAPPSYPDKRLSPWQKEMADSLHRGENLIADVVTSCGKTWAANLITAWEVLSRDTPDGAKDTALIISPNSEVMRDTVKDISENHTKTYNFDTKVLLRTLTRNFTTFDMSKGPDTQLVVVSVECVEEFITDPVNEDFVANLRIIVFDEVHMRIVTRALWWSQYIPHIAQLVLLSATLGDPVAVQETVNEIQSLQEARPRTTRIIKYRVRPIPLQPLVFKGCDTPTQGVNSKELTEGPGKLGCIINRFDPTVRDIKSLLGRGAEIPDDREGQFELGQRVVNDPTHTDTINEKMESVLDEAVIEPTPENIYNLLCYLFCKDKQPVMVFNTTAGATEDLAKRLIRHIAELESDDSEFVHARKEFVRYEKEQYRTRDKKPRNKSQERDKGTWEQCEEEKVEKINIHAVRAIMARWKFLPKKAPMKTPDGLPQWIQDCLEYGIGIYVSTMKVWQRHLMFDAFREGQIKVLFSDSTISVGINLPIRTVVACGTMAHDLYKQATGRAGRRGMDDQGFIVHMMEKDDIRRCMTREVPEVELVMPKRMTHADLIRLLVPHNLDKFSEGGTETFELAAPVAEYKQRILRNYLATLSPTDQDRCVKQIQLLHREGWHYSKITNLVKTLPETNSILLMKLLVQGHLKKISATEFIDLVALLFCRVEDPGPDGYVPEFPCCPDLRDRLAKYADAYGIEADFERPISRYFPKFCRDHMVDLERLPEIITIGEWMYALRRGVTSVSPSKSSFSGKDKFGKPQFKREYHDPFTKMLIQVDNGYCAARSHCSV